MFAQILTRKNNLFFLLLATLVQQGSLSALFWAKTLPPAPTVLSAPAQTFQLESPLYHSNVPLSWEWSWNNLKKNCGWADSHFLGIPRDAKEAQEMLTVALKNNGNILKWATIISGGLLLASAGLYLYEQHLQENEREHRHQKKSLFQKGFEVVNNGGELKKALLFPAAVVFFGTLGWRSWYIGKLKEIAIRG